MKADLVELISELRRLGVTHYKTGEIELQLLPTPSQMDPTAATQFAQRFASSIPNGLNMLFGSVETQVDDKTMKEMAEAMGMSPPPEIQKES